MRPSVELTMRGVWRKGKREREKKKSSLATLRTEIFNVTTRRTTDKCDVTMATA